jgi:hypothetical protein
VGCSLREGDGDRKGGKESRREIGEADEEVAAMNSKAVRTAGR